jgi:hydroxymethylglutaryl-CoA lyase
MSRRIEIVEVGPRDGLQNEAAILSVEDKLAFIARLEAAGARRIEALPPAPPGGSRIGLVLNQKGWARCVEAGCDEANLVVCATDGFGVRNQGASTAEQMETLAAVSERAKHEGPPLSLTISVAFGCPFDGEVPEARVVEIARAAASAGIGEIALADTIGVADPWTVRRRIEAVRAVAPDARLRLHFHDTRRSGLANAYAGVEAGVPSPRTLQATSRRRTSSTCWSGADSRRAWISPPSSRRPGGSPKSSASPRRRPSPAPEAFPTRRLRTAARPAS